MVPFIYLVNTEENVNSLRTRRLVYYNADDGGDDDGNDGF